MKPTISLSLLLAALFGSLALLTASNPAESRRDFKIGVWYDVVDNIESHVELTPEQVKLAMAN